MFYKTAHGAIMTINQLAQTKSDIHSLLLKKEKSILKQPKEFYESLEALQKTKNKKDNKIVWSLVSLFVLFCVSMSLSSSMATSAVFFGVLVAITGWIVFWSNHVDENFAKEQADIKKLFTPSAKAEDIQFQKYLSDVVSVWPENPNLLEIFGGDRAFLYQSEYKKNLEDVFKKLIRLKKEEELQNLYPPREDNVLVINDPDEEKVLVGKSEQNTDWSSKTG